MRVLVTGASGFLGGRTARLLVEEHEVVGTGRVFPPSRRRALQEAGVRLRTADLTAADSLRPLLQDVDAVVHCAALSTLWGRRDQLQRINVDASARLARASAERGLRLVHISSPSIYNRAVHEDPRWGTPQRPVPESLPVGPRFDSDYARSKHLAERAVIAAHPDACLLRPRGIYGPGDTSIVPRIVAALESRRLPRLVDGDVLTDLTHVDNAAHAIALALDSEVTGAVNIADGTPIAIWDGIDRLADHRGLPRPRRRLPAAPVERAAGLVEQVARRLGRAEPRLTATGIRLLTRGMRLDLTRAREELGYAPVREDGLASAWEEEGA